MRRTRRVLLLVIVFFVSGLPAAAGQPLTDDEHSSDPDGASHFESDGTLVDTDAAGASDIASMARLRGWSLEAAEAQDRATEVVGALAEQIAAERPDKFVVSAVSPEPFGNPSIYIKGRADEYIVGLVEALPIAVDVLDNQPHSRSELEARHDALAASLRKSDYRDVSIRNDWTRGGHMRVTVANESALTPEAVRAVNSERTH